MTTPSIEIEIGTPVYTSDHEKLGTVAEVRESNLRIDVSMKPDYWLSADFVRPGHEDGRITMVFDNEHLDDYKQDVHDEEVSPA